MAVQKSKVSRSRRGARRSHNALKSPTLSTDQTTGERHLRHYMTEDGFYKGKGYGSKVKEILRRLPTASKTLVTGSSRGSVLYLSFF